jgi:hypothetical protein
MVNFIYYSNTIRIKKKFLSFFFACDLWVGNNDDYYYLLLFIIIKIIIIDDIMAFFEICFKTRLKEILNEFK